jgi:hypothetical protein
MFLLFIIQNLVEFQRILMLIGKVSHFGVSVASFRGRLVTFEVKVVEIGVKVASHFSPNCPCPHYTAVKLDTKKPWGKLRQRRCNPCHRKLILRHTCFFFVRDRQVYLRFRSLRKITVILAPTIPSLTVPNHT